MAAKGQSKPDGIQRVSGLRAQVDLTHNKPRAFSRSRQAARKMHCFGRPMSPKSSFVRVARHTAGAVLLHLQKANGLGVPVGLAQN